MANSASVFTAPANSSDVEAVADAADRRATQWLDLDDAGHDTAATRQLAELVRDPNGVRFTMDFVDRVARPEDDAVAAAALKKLNAAPSFLGTANALMLKTGAQVGTLLPGIVMPIARARMRQMVGHLVLDAGGRSLNRLLEKAKEEGTQLNLNLLGEAVLGEAEAISRTGRIIELMKNPLVTYVSVKASSLCAQLNHWDFEGTLTRLKDRLRPVYREAIARGVFVNLDMEEYHDLELTTRLFTELLSEEEFHDYHGGIVLQAYLPDTLPALNQLTEFARARRDAGGAPIKIRLVKGANLSMERATAEIHGWPQAPYTTKADVDANYLRLLDVALQPENAGAVRIGVASHNLYTLGLALELAIKREMTEHIDAEMLQGMAPGQANAVREAFGSLILYTPVVRPEDFDVAISYLVRRLEENAEPQNFLYSLFAPEMEPPTPLQQQAERFRNAVRDRWATPVGPRRTQDRTAEAGSQAPKIGRFANEPDTDPALPANRQWGLAALATDPGPIQHEEVTDLASVDKAVARARELGAAWGTKSGHDRQEVLRKIGDQLADARGKLISVMAWEADKSIDQSDPEVSEAIDFASFYGYSAAALDDTDAQFSPRTVTLVVPPWNFPVAIPVGGMLAGLAAGSAVIIKPAPQVVRCAEVAVEAIRAGLAAAGEDPDLLQLVRTDEGAAGKALISHDGVDQVILTGASDTAALFRSWRPELRIQAETSGKNALIITPNADPDLAVADLYRSAFGHAGQKCSAASLVILVGKRSERIIHQLVDAVATLKIGHGTDPATAVNGLIEPPGEKLTRGLTQLDGEETWLVEPRQLDEEGLLWSPGIRDNVAPGSWYHTHECFGPVLGVMHAETLEQAIEWQNSTGYGLTAGLHSLDDDEISYWIEHVEAGNAYVNRGITGAIVERQPFGGWKYSVVGPGAKAGGPNYVAQLGDWSDGPLRARSIDVAPKVARILRAHEDLPDEDKAWLWRAAEYDAAAWRHEFGREHDPIALTSEANIFRYRRLLQPLQLRVGEGFAVRDVIRYQVAAALTGSPMEITAAAPVAHELRKHDIEATVCSAETFAARIAATPSTRVRALGAVEDGVREAAVASQSVVLDAPVLADGRRELLSLLLEQAVSVTMHRFGIVGPVAGIER